ncbi:MULTISPECIES: hypothetical protein [Gordonia]|uniref:Uncharacterized protein n=1 Tax=Gordonia tangerina TaxID=2911060 RepID=A0ABS9DGH7_9ACTN|nr:MULTISPECIES: hypothetical protein [Gordonia]MAU80454.1 hypothetical protein [Gordonia sp. (in: high G+C Gram-positive bacteria)]MCF3937365.1 hypothetical protein [Gordonia tangerina]
MAETRSAQYGGGSSSDGSVLGISVVEDRVASVVRGADGDIIASNLVDLPDPSAQSAENAIHELVDSVPYEINRIGVACARPATQSYLQANLAPGTSRPAWYDKVAVTDMPAALAEVARTAASGTGIVAAIDLDRDAVPSPGSSVVNLDSATGEVLGTAEFAYGSPGPVTDPAHAGAVADAVMAAPGGSAVTSVVLTGPGAEVAGTSAALEYALARPVTVVDQPALAAAVGAAVLALRPGAVVRTPSTRRWWLIGAAMAAALALGAIAASAVFAGVDATEEEPTPTTTVTETAEASTVTRTAAPVTEVRTRVATTTVTESRDATSTTTETETETETSTETETVTEQPTETVTETTTVSVAGQTPGP